MQNRIEERPWLSSYQKGVPAEIDPDVFSSLSELAAASFTRYASQPAFENMGAALSFGDVDRLSSRLASYLQYDCNLAKGERVAVMMPNLLQYPVAVFGILRAGLVVVNVNPQYTARELEHQLKDSGAKAVIVLENFCHTLQTVLEATAVEVVITCQIGELLPAPKRWLVNAVVKRIRRIVPSWSIAGTTTFRKALSRGAIQPPKPVKISGEDSAFLQYTGGTTGVAKGAVLTHRNMVANVEQSYAWMAPVIGDGQDCVITALPLYHIFALLANCLIFVRSGARNVLITDPRDMPGFVKILSKQKFTVITGVNTLFNGLLNTPGFEKLDFSSLRLAVGGGMAVQRSVSEKWSRVTGKSLCEGYGLTETSPVVSFYPLDGSTWNGSVGVPLPSTDVKLVGDDGQPSPAGEPGELCVKGPQVMKGYWNRPDETAKVFLPDGWLRTGDLAVIDAAGFIKIVDRKKDMILVSGFNVYPNEVEDVVAAIPGVLEVACIGVPDDNSGEAVKLFIVRRDPALTEEQVRAYCKENLTGYKRPKAIEFRDSLPKSNVGKILRKELRPKAPTPS